MTTDQPTPEHLGKAGAALWRDAVDGFEMSLPEQAALLQAAETIDTLRVLEDAIRRDGVITDAGRPSPLLAEARQQRATLVRLLGLLDLRLDDESGSRPALSPSRAASKAASARWQQSRTKGRFNG